MAASRFKMRERSKNRFSSFRLDRPLRWPRTGANPRLSPQMRRLLEMVQFPITCFNAAADRPRSRPPPRHRSLRADPAARRRQRLRSAEASAGLAAAVADTRLGSSRELLLLQRVGGFGGRAVRAVWLRRRRRVLSRCSMKSCCAGGGGGVGVGSSAGKNIDFSIPEIPGRASRNHNAMVYTSRRRRLWQTLKQISDESRYASVRFSCRLSSSRFPSAERQRQLGSVILLQRCGLTGAVIRVPGHT